VVVFGIDQPIAWVCIYVFNDGFVFAVGGDDVFVVIALPDRRCGGIKKGVNALGDG